MGKLVKYCSSCDEGFAERFGFCPVCGATLQAFEMNPVAAGAELEALLRPKDVGRHAAAHRIALRLLEEAVAIETPAENAG